MDALVMCGGRGTRLQTTAEKPLVEVVDEPMIDRVLAALEGSAVETVHAVVSPQTPETTHHVADETAAVRIDAPGDGYVADLGYALERVATPVLTVASDLPLLTADAVDDVLDRFDGASLTVCVPVALKRRLGASVDTTTTVDGCTVAPTGVNVVASGTAAETYVRDARRLAINVNRPRDVRVAEAVL